MNKGKIGEVRQVLSRNNVEKENGVATKHNREINWYKYRERNGTSKEVQKWVQKLQRTDFEKKSYQIVLDLQFFLFSSSLFHYVFW